MECADIFYLKKKHFLELDLKYLILLMKEVLFFF